MHCRYCAAHDFPTTRVAPVGHTSRTARTQTKVHSRGEMGAAEFRQWFRTIEFFEGFNGWYFLSHDGLAVGPYVTERAAETHAMRLAKILKRLDDQRSTRIAVIEFTMAGHGAGV
jgi:hypothetical protein